jgi:hypothetical protein
VIWWTSSTRMRGLRREVGFACLLGGGASVLSWREWGVVRGSLAQFHRLGEYRMARVQRSMGRRVMVLSKQPEEEVLVSAAHPVS